MCHRRVSRVKIFAELPLLCLSKRGEWTGSLSPPTLICIFSHYTGESWWCTAPACLHKTRNQTPHHESHCRSVSECVFVKAATALLSIKLSCIPKCFCHIDLLKRKPHNRDDAWKYSVSCWNRTSVRFIGGWVTQPPREGLLVIKPQTDELAGINMWRSPLSQLSVRGWSTDKKECANEKRSYKWIQK